MGNAYMLSAIAALPAFYVYDFYPTEYAKLKLIFCLVIGITPGLYIWHEAHKKLAKLSYEI